MDLTEAVIPVVAGPYEFDGVTLRKDYLEAIRLSPLIMHGGLPVPLVTGYEDVRRLQRDRRLKAAGLQVMQLQGITRGPLHERIKRSVLSLDGEAHVRLRSLAGRALTPHMVERVRQFVRDRVQTLIDIALARGSCWDAIELLTGPLPAPVISHLLGIPEEDVATFESNAAIILRMLGFGGDLIRDLPVVEHALDQNDQLMANILARQKKQPTDGLLSALAAARDGGDTLRIDEICVLASDLMIAGTDSTRNQLGLALRLFCDHPDQWQRIRGDPTLLQPAIEECLRRIPTTTATPRVVAEDIELHGVRIPAGSFVAMSSVAANFDARVFPDPVVFDVGRDDGPSVTFGAGAHHCLGSHLARLELQEAIGALTERIVSFELAGEPEWKPATVQRGLAKLPLQVVSGG